jgi:hypothetical protein
LDADKFLEMPYLRTIRNAAATIKAISFFLGPIIAGGILLGYLVTTYVRSRTALAAIAIISLFMILGTVRVIQCPDLLWELYDSFGAPE